MPLATVGRRRVYCSEACRIAAWREKQSRAKQRSVHHRSDRQTWSTPQDFFDALDREFGFTLDVCALPENAKCKRFFTPQDDGLAQPWEGVCWCNPPYSQVAAWVAKARQSAAEGAVVVWLVPSRTDTRWWHNDVQHGEVRFLSGRLRFGDGKGTAPFPSAIVVFRDAPAVTKYVAYDRRGGRVEAASDA